MKIAQVLVMAAAVVGCFFVSVPAGSIMAAAFAIVTVMQINIDLKRRKSLMRLCDEIDKILHGAESVDLASYSEGEVGILTAEIQKMTIRLREQNSALRDDRELFREALEDISHQLRTPLTSLMLIIGTLRRNDISQEKRMSAMREMNDLLLRMKWMIETMLGLSRIEAGAVVFQREKLSMNQLIRDSLEPIAISLELKDIAVKTECPEGLFIEADRRYTCEAVTNLLKNAMEHTPSGGSITISASDNGVYRGMVIADTGCGIPENELPKIFDRFHSGSDGKTGYGIGLAFARKIICSQNGSLIAGNLKDGGAYFDMRFYHSTV